MVAVNTVWTTVQTLMGVVRGVSLPSPIDLTRRPYNTGHRVTVWYVLKNGG